MKKFISIIIVLTLITGCKKYPDDNVIHFRTSEKRLIRCWCKSGYPYGSVALRFNKDGAFIGVLYQINIHGTWEFIENKNKLRIINPSNNTSFFFTITLLEKYKGKYYLHLQDDSTTYYYIEQEPS